MRRIVKPEEIFTIDLVKLRISGERVGNVEERAGGQKRHEPAQIGKHEGQFAYLQIDCNSAFRGK